MTRMNGAVLLEQSRDSDGDISDDVEAWAAINGLPDRSVLGYTGNL